MSVRATYVLIAANVVVWLFITLFISRSPSVLWSFLLSFGVVPIFVVNGANLFSLLSYMFVHVDFFHILLNMYALLLFGRDVEEYVGTGRFLFIYFVSGVAAALFHIFYFVAFLSLNCSPTIRPIPQACLIPSIGASGAIFGLMGAYLVFFPFRKLYAFLGFIPIVAPAFVVIGFFVLIQTLFMLTTPFSTIAYTAHVGGFAAGLLLSLPFRNAGPSYFFYE